MFRKDLIKPDGRRLHLYSRKPISDGIIATNPPHDPVKPNPHMRWHPLRGEWVIYASHRQDRTFLPPKEYSPLAVTKSMDFPTELPAGDYEMAVFENLFPALSLGAEGMVQSSVETQAGVGVCEVVVFTQDPDASLGALSVEEVKLVLQVLADRTKEIGANPQVKYVLPFENRGVEVGVTLHHPHGQIYSYPFVPPVPAKMLEMQLKHFEKNGRTLLQDFTATEVNDGRRIIANEKTAKAYLPACARYAYETWVVPDRPVAWLYDLNEDELMDLAKTLKTVLMKFDKMWDRPFPYLLTLFQAPTDGAAHPAAHAHFQIFPAYRTQGKLKYLAGTELGGGIFVNDSYPEVKAAELQAVEVKF
ncbi:MAG: galactose-1-phosphate uridylyltransferase [Bdellovibrionota bacterium]